MTYCTIKKTILWSSLLVMFGLFAHLLLSDFTPVQTEVTQIVNIHNKVNICLPIETETLNLDIKH